MLKRHRTLLFIRKTDDPCFTSSLWQVALYGTAALFLKQLSHQDLNFKMLEYKATQRIFN